MPTERNVTVEHRRIVAQPYIHAERIEYPLILSDESRQTVDGLRHSNLQRKRILFPFGSNFLFAFSCRRILTTAASHCDEYSQKQ